jgi:hypothetical protein
MFFFAIRSNLYLTFSLGENLPAFDFEKSKKDLETKVSHLYKNKAALGYPAECAI